MMMMMMMMMMIIIIIIMAFIKESMLIHVVRIRKTLLCRETLLTEKVYHLKRKAKTAKSA